MRAFTTGIARSVTGSLGRFLAIVGIVALGCGFFAGLRMAGPDMRASADAYYDETRLWDLRVVSTLGLADADLARLSQEDGVAAVAGSTSVDVMARVGSEQVAVRVATIPEEYVGAGGETGEKDAGAEKDADAAGDDGPALDRLVLREGSWPEAADECVASADNPALPVSPGDVIEVLYEAGDADVLAVRELTVTGTVSSSAYPYTVSFGSTTLGSGMLDQYLFVPSAAFVEGTPYTEAHLAVEGAPALESGSEAYEDAVGGVDAALEARAGELAEARLADVRADAQAEVDEARSELDRQREEADSELAAAAGELDAAEAELSDGEARLAEGQAAYDAAAAELASARDAAASELASAASALDDAQAELDARTAALDAAAPQAKAARSACEQGLPVLLAALAGQGVEASDAAGALSAVDAALAQLDATRPGLVDSVAALEAAEAAGALTPEQAAQLAAARDQLAQLDARREALQAVRDEAARLAEAADAVSAYDAGRAQASAAASQIASGRDELARRRAQADSELAAAQAQLDASAAELASSRAQVASGRAELEEGRAELARRREEAAAAIADAQAAVDDAQARVDGLEAGDVYVLDRTQSEGQAAYQGDSERMDAIATAFPLMFFLVAALVSLTTMTRMVEDERSQIGTYKALGYGTARIASKYLAYAGLAATAGAILGTAVLTQVLPSIVMGTYGIIYAVPPLAPPLPVDPVVALTSGGVGVAVTLLATWAAVVSTLRETPASLMQPRAPKAGRRILLERVGPLWRRLSFSRKVTARNLFRYKRRLLMTVVGISGCTALLLVGFGLHDAIWDIIDNQFGPILHYDTTVSLDDAADEGDLDQVAALLAGTGRVDDLAHVRLENVQAGSDAADGTFLVQLVVAEDVGELSDAVSLRDRVTGEPVGLAPDGVVLAEKTATRLGVRAGDTVRLFGQDAIGTATGEGCEVRVAGVTENYVGNVAYAPRELLASLADAGVVGSADGPFSTIYATSDDDPAFREGLADELQATGHVSTVAFVDDTVAMYRDMLSVIDTIVAVLIVSAAALAFIVLYNLTNINIGERVREIATLKVLGFFRGEVYAYVFREVMLLALLGDALGMALGTWLEGYVIVTAEVDAVMFGRVIHPASYVWAFALTLAFAGLVTLAMRRKLDHVDMVESLKSVE